MILFLVWVSLNVIFLDSIPFHSRSGSEEEISSAISGFLLPEFFHDSPDSSASQRLPRLSCYQSSQISLPMPPDHQLRCRRTPAGIPSLTSFIDWME